MKLLVLLAGLALLFSYNVEAEKQRKEPLKSTELKLAACDVLVENYSISMKECKRMNNFVIEKNYTQEIISGIGIELSNKSINCHLYASREVIIDSNEVILLSDWKVEEDLRSRTQGCVE